jgi:hypothetical protein
MTEPNAAEWLSAWSTFWGAIAAGIGAVGTVGALWVGALTLRRQVNDKHREQASAITVGAQLIQTPLFEDRYRCFISNGSHLPIYDVQLSANFDDARTSDRVDVLEPGKFLEYHVGIAEQREVLAQFADSSGNYWMRNSRGKLTPRPKNTRLHARRNRTSIWWITHKPKWLKRPGM